MSPEYPQKKEYVPENVTVIQTKNRNFWKRKSFVLGIAVGAILVCVVAAVVVVVVKLKETRAASHESHWTYDEQDEWGGYCQTGLAQSPIDLVPSEASQSEELPSLLLEDIDYFEDIEVTNSGHTVNVKLNCVGVAAPKLSGAGLAGKFTLDNIHFHWPSEHTINGRHYALEAHFVFYEEAFSSLTEALDYPNAVTVIGVLYKESGTENVTTHENFDVIDKAVTQVSRSVGKSVTASGGITISDFFPEDTDAFFRYTGSLTTPDCNGDVNWIVLSNSARIYSEDLDDLVRIYTEDSERLTYNNREVQELNGRVVYLRDD